MIKPLLVATGGYLPGRTPLSMYSDGYLQIASPGPPPYIDPPPLYGNGGGTPKYKKKIYESLEESDISAILNREDEEITLIIKIFMQCQ